MQITFSRCDQLERFNIDGCVIFTSLQKKKIIYPNLPDTIDLKSVKAFMNPIEGAGDFSKIFYFALADKPRLRIVVGLGDVKKLTDEKFRKLGGLIFSALKKHEIATACIQLPSFDNIPLPKESIVEALSEAFLLTEYSYDE